MTTSSHGMSAAELAAHAAKLVTQGAKYSEIREECWAEAKAIEAELQRMKWRGFASMPVSVRKAIAAKGGLSTHGRRYRFTSETARLAGVQSAVVHPRSAERMRELGRLSGASRRRKGLS